MSTRLSWALAIALIAMSFLGSALVYHRLPDTIPIHWNWHGQADDYRPKLWAVWLLPGAMLALLLVFAALPWLSPKNFGIGSFRSTYQWIVVIVMALLAYVHAFTLSQALQHKSHMSNAFVAGMFLFFALIGNVMGKVRRNFFVGIRVPWTLASERVWNETHRMAAWMFVAAGLIGFALAWAGWLLASLIVLFVALVVPVVYSLVLSKHLEKLGEL